MTYNFGECIVVSDSKSSVNICSITNYNLIARNVFFYLTLVALFFILMKELMHFRVDVFNKAGYVLSVLCSVVVFFLTKKKKVEWFLGGLFLSVTIVSLLMGLKHGVVSYYYTDYFVISSLLFFLSIVSRSYDVSVFEKFIACSFYFSAILMAFNLVTGFAVINGRFPAISPYVSCLFYLFCLSDKKFSFNILLFSFFVLVLTFLSGSKTSFFLVLFSFFVYLWSVVRKRLFVFFLMSSLFFAAASMCGSMLYDKFENSRMSQVFDIENNYSNAQRVYEVNDVLFYVRKSFESGSINWALGYGSGAVFKPIESCLKGIFLMMAQYIIFIQLLLLFSIDMES